MIRPTLPEFDGLYGDLKEIYASGMLTNAATVRRFEERTAEYLGVRNAVAVSCCTSGLMLALRGMELSGEVIVPSFTFCASVHSLVWNGLTPVFVDATRDSHIDLDLIEPLINEKTCAIMAVHLFGTPCKAEALEALAAKHGLRLIFDAAHAYGSIRQGKKCGGFGDAEAFSLSPTKLLIAGEGGMVTTDDDELARRVRIGRDYGNPGDYNCEFVGLNARMSEFHAALALASLDMLEENIALRNEIAAYYRSELAALPGISWQTVEEGDRSTLKDFSIIVEEPFPLSRDALAAALLAEGIETRPYFHPAVHEQDAYAHMRAGNGPLPVTEMLSRCSLSIPLYSHMPDEEAEAVVEAMKRLGN